MSVIDGHACMWKLFIQSQRLHSTQTLRPERERSFACELCVFVWPLPATGNAHVCETLPEYTAIPDPKDPPHGMARLAPIKMS
jgi:hypothetical protein